VVTQLGRSCHRRIFNPDAIPVPDFQEQLQADAFALQLRSSALPLLGVHGGVRYRGRVHLLKPPEVQCRTILDSMSKFDGALATRWRGNLSHPISAVTCDAQFQRAPERHPGSLRCKSLLTGQVLFQVRIRPEIAFLENGAGRDRSCVTAQCRPSRLDWTTEIIDRLGGSASKGRSDLS